MHDGFVPSGRNRRADITDIASVPRIPRKASNFGWFAARSGVYGQRMLVVIAGGHGKIARLCARLLVERGDSVLGIIRKPEHADDLRAESVEPVLADLEQVDSSALAEHLAGADAAIFAAGAGPGSGIQRKDTVDRGASVLLADACERAGVRRFLQISSKGTAEANPPDVSEIFAAYLDAKRAAEADLRRRDLDWTILRPGWLTNDPPTGRVLLAPTVEWHEVTRGDVAAVLVALLNEPASARHALELINDGTAIPNAVRQAVT